MAGGQTAGLALNRFEIAELTGESACPTSVRERLLFVAQALSPANRLSHDFCEIGCGL